MATPPPEGKPRQPLAHSALKWSALGLLTLLVTLGSNLFRPTIHGLQVAGDIVHRSRDYREQIRANDALEQEIAFLRTQQGTDWAVHKYMGMYKPGEQVGRAVEDSQPQTKPLTRRERVRLWVSQREDASAKRLHELGEIMSCYGGLRPPDQPPGHKGAPEARNQKARDVSNHKAPGTSSPSTQGPQAPTPRPSH